MATSDCSVRVAVRVRPLNASETAIDCEECIQVFGEKSQIVAGSDISFSFDRVYGPNSSQVDVFDECVEFVDAAFEGFNATILAYGQTGSGKTWTMGSSSDAACTMETQGIIPRVIKLLFDRINRRESEDLTSSYKVHVQFLEIYGDDIRDLLDHTKTSKVTIREAIGGDMIVSGAREEMVSSAEQMMSALEKGTKHRATASTRMNLESSRSHAIFTIVLEHTINSSVIVEPADGIVDDIVVEGAGANDVATMVMAAQGKTDVRRSKFHFVDLAGSERAKRTGAQGQQMREAIDINKGLLALGNVISALGDEQKRGKVHVPFRDSKLTRFLQDSLGGNSKTLFICCVSPARVNYNESVNALRYANRARNIKNKPIINRDPSLLMLELMKALVVSFASDLLAARNAGFVSPSRIDAFQLESIVNSGTCSLNNGSSVFQRKECDNGSARPQKPTVASSDLLNKLSPPPPPPDNRMNEYDFEIKRLTNQLKLARLHNSEVSDALVLIESERDYFKAKWESTLPEAKFEPILNAPAEIEEAVKRIGGTDDGNRREIVGLISTYVREVAELKLQLATSQCVAAEGASFIDAPEDSTIDTDLTSSVARVIAQTRQQLIHETRRLKLASSLAGPAATADGDSKTESSAVPLDEFSLSDDIERLNMEEESRAEADERDFVSRQRLLQSEVFELGQSILLKEQLVQQLQRSQYQYGLMKSFYEEKLHALTEEVEQKEGERDRLAAELQDVVSSQASGRADQEERLRTELKRREEELKAMKKRQDELSGLSQVQTRYLQQVSKLDSEIADMKKQRVDLARTLQVEKKKHILALNEKSKEIDRLKRDLLKSSDAVKRLSKEKERAEDKAREAMREGSLARKRVNDLLKFAGSSSSSISSDAARRAVQTASKLKSAITSRRFLSDEQVKAKEYVERSLTSLLRREDVADKLQRACEKQFAFVAVKENQSAHSENSSELASSIDNQLHLHGLRIAELQREITSADLRVDEDRIFDSLHQSFSANLPSAQQTVRLLLGMLISSRRNLQACNADLDLARSREGAMREELSSLSSRLLSSDRQRDNELTSAFAEYEAKLQGLLNHGAPSSSSSRAGTRVAENVQLAVALERCDGLQAQLRMKDQNVLELQARVKTLDAHLVYARNDLTFKDSSIAFLEEERDLFREMAEDYRAGITSLGGTASKSIIAQIKSKAGERGEGSVRLSLESIDRSSSEHNHILQPLFPGTDDDEDFESESILDGFNNIGEEIQKTNSITTGRLVYDRLAAPVNFTGAMKNVFENDLPGKRRRVQQVKNLEKQRNIISKQRSDRGGLTGEITVASAKVFIPSKKDGTHNDDVGKLVDQYSDPATTVATIDSAQEAMESTSTEVSLTARSLSEKESVKQKSIADAAVPMVAPELDDVVEAIEFLTKTGDSHESRTLGMESINDLLRLNFQIDKSISKNGSRKSESPARGVFLESDSIENMKLQKGSGRSISDRLQMFMSKSVIAKLVKKNLDPERSPSVSSTSTSSSSPDTVSSSSPSNAGVPIPTASPSKTPEIRKNSWLGALVKIASPASKDSTPSKESHRRVYL